MVKMLENMVKMLDRFPATQIKINSEEASRNKSRRQVISIVFCDCVWSLNEIEILLPTICQAKVTCQVINRNLLDCGRPVCAVAPLSQSCHEIMDTHRFGALIALYHWISVTSEMSNTALLI